MHSVKNRFMMRVKNISWDLYRRNFVSITTRDLLVFAACLVREHSSLKAFWYVAKNFRSMLEKRAEIMRRKRVSDEYIASWFRYQPVSHPAPKPSVKALARAAARVRSARG
jgi:hypothetical protein